MRYGVHQVQCFFSHHFGNVTRSVWIGKNDGVLTQIHFLIIMYVLKLQLQPVDLLKPRVKNPYVKGIYLNCHSIRLRLSVLSISLCSWIVKNVHILFPCYILVISSHTMWCPNWPRLWNKVTNKVHSNKVDMV